MDKDNAVDEFLGDLKNNDGDSVFEAQDQNPFGDQNETVADEEVIENKEEKPLPFHKDPKVLRFVEKEISKRLAEQKTPTEEKRFVEETGDEIDEVLARIIGNDTPEKVSAIKDFKRVLLEREEKGAERALREIENRRNAESELQRQAQEELEQGFETIEDTFSVDITSDTPQARKLRGDYIDFVKRIGPKNADGEIIDYPDFEETFKLFQEMNKIQTTNRSKELSSRSMTRTGGTPTVPVAQGQSFKDVDKLFSKMFGK